MQRKFTIVLAALLLPLAPCIAAAAGDPPAAQTLWLEVNGSKLKTSIYESTRLSSHPVLPPTTYHYIFADEATRKIDDVVVAAVLRPGYRDHSGERSDGNMGMATGRTM